MEQQNQEILLFFFLEVPYQKGEIERQTLEIRLRSYKRRLKRSLSLGSCSDTTSIFRHTHMCLKAQNCLHALAALKILPLFGSGSCSCSCSGLTAGVVRGAHSTSWARTANQHNVVWFNSTKSAVFERNCSVSVLCLFLCVLAFRHLMTLFKFFTWAMLVFGYKLHVWTVFALKEDKSCIIVFLQVWVPLLWQRRRPWTYSPSRPKDRWDPGWGHWNPPLGENHFPRCQNMF